jgi:glyoxylase-like metal-dependent hydrolase (beta-lactamase superfamily II)
VDLGDQTLIFDTTLTPQAGIDLNLTAEALTNRQVTMVINSHYHIDHTWGNQAFHPDCDLITSEETMRLMARKTPEEYRQLKEEIAEQSRSMEQLSLQSYPNHDLTPPKLWMSYAAGIQEALPRLRPRIPNITFDHHMTIHGSRRSAILYSFSGGHTSSDTVLFLPEERILCAGDLVYTNLHPYLSEADLSKLVPILNELSALDPVTLLPGHGPVASKDALRSMLRYLGRLEEIATRLLSKGSISRDLPKIPFPAMCSNWELEEHFHPNLYHMVLHVIKQTGALEDTAFQLQIYPPGSSFSHTAGFPQAVYPNSI